MEWVVLRRKIDVAANVFGKRGIDLVEHVLAVVERPHLADCLVADAGDDPPMSSMTASTARRFAFQSSRVRGSCRPTAKRSPVTGSMVVMTSRVAGSCAMS